MSEFATEIYRAILNYRLRDNFYHQFIVVVVCSHRLKCVSQYLLLNEANDKVCERSPKIYDDQVNFYSMYVKNLVNKVINFFGKTNSNGGGGGGGVWPIICNGSAMAPLFFPL